MLEYCVEPSPLRTLITKDPIQVVDGYARVPDGPGLGIEVDLDAVQQYVCHV
jgi:D-galactarolactone cycloisomerase